MSNIDKRAELRKELSNPAIGSNAHLRKLALALLDELEAKDKSIDFLKEQLAQLANFNPDWDKLEAATDSLREHIAKLSSAEKRIAELEAREVVVNLPAYVDGRTLGYGEVNHMIDLCADAIEKAGHAAGIITKVGE